MKTSLFSAGFYMSIIYLVLMSTSSCCSKQDAAVLKNILFIIVDDLRPELGCYGNTKIKTPNIDRLAVEGQLFERAFCQVPVCGASRASMFTGAYPNERRFRDYNTWVDQDMPESTTLFKHLRKNNYYTASYGKVYHHADDQIDSWSTPPYRRIAIGSYNWRDYALTENIKEATKRVGRSSGVGPAFEKADVHDTIYYDGKMTREVIKELRKSKKRDKPSCIAAGFLKPHLPFNAPEKYWNFYQKDSFDMPPNYEPNPGIPEVALHNWGELRAYTNIPNRGPLDEVLAKKIIHGYYACVSYIDAQIGLIIKELEELNLRKKTIIVLVGDHGWNLGDHSLWAKHCLFNSSLHAPLILSIPEYESGIRIPAVISLADIYPSLCELIDLEIPPLVEGKSFTNNLANPDMAGKKSYAKYKNGECIATDRYSYIRYSNRENNETVARMLFDHEKDSLEINNLINSETHELLIDSLQLLLLENKYLP